MTRPPTAPPTPAALGYRMPAEWERHAGTWLAWPRPEGISFPGLYDRIPGVWRAIVEALAPGETVHVTVRDDAHAREVAPLVAAARGEVALHPIPTDEPWCRDHGPMFVVRDAAPGGRELAVVDWAYNAWGGKYPPYERDDAVPAAVAALLGVPRFAPGLVLEGGSIDVNGRGTVLTTEGCLLHPSRNPHCTRADLERALAAFLGVRHVIWLGDGIAGDDTDGHVDDLARFVAPRTVVTVVEDDPADENHRVLADNRRRLAAARDQDGRPLEVIELPMPAPVVRDGTRLPASYANFYVANAVVLVPTFADRQDARALAILGRCFPDRRVMGLDARDLVWGLGAFHCVTQQQPLASAPRARQDSRP